MGRGAEQHLMLNSSALLMVHIGMCFFLPEKVQTTPMPFKLQLQSSERNNPF